MRSLLAAVAATLVLAAPAQAFTNPEVYVRTAAEQRGPWIALASAPRVNFLGGWEIGYKLQPSAASANFQTVALTIVSVPDGAPTQPNNSAPYCVGRAGTPGEIVEAGPPLQFEGNGTYALKVAIGDTTGSGCFAGPSTTRSFSVDVHVTPSVVGRPLVHRAKLLPGRPFVGVRAPSPAGGLADIRCSLGATAIPDPTFSHPEIPEFVFPRPGTWSCMARGTSDGLDATGDSVRFGTPWSAPIAVEVGSDFRYAGGKIRKPRSRRPRLVFKAEFPGPAQGGQATVKLVRVTGCTRRRYKVRKAGTYRARFGAKRVEVAIKRPRDGWYMARFSFQGTHFLRPARDAEPYLIAVQRKRVQYVGPSAFHPC